MTDLLSFQSNSESDSGLWTERKILLDNNGKSAVRKLKDSLPLRKELDRLKDDLSNQLQLSDIR